MLAAAVPRLRLATPLGRSQWLLPRRHHLSTSVPNVTPAAGTGAGDLEPPDLPRLANAARISLSPWEAEEFAPKIHQVVDWFGQLQAVDLESIEPSLGAGTAADSSLREDEPETFANRDAIVRAMLCGQMLSFFFFSQLRDAIVRAILSYDDPYIKVPRVLNKD